MTRQTKPKSKRRRVEIALLLCLLAFVALPLTGLPLRASRAVAETGMYNVRDYGAKGDGVADDAAAIRSAIAAGVAASKVVYFPAGTYKTTSSITLPTNLSVQGDGAASIITMPAQARHTYIFVGVGSDNVSLQGLTFRSSSFENKVSGLYTIDAQNWHLSDLRFDNLWYGMQLSLGTSPYPVSRGWVVGNITATNCRTPMYAVYLEDSSFAGLNLQGAGTNQDDHCIYLDEGIHRVTFTNLNLTQGAGYGLQLYISRDGTSSDCTFTNVTIDATPGKWPMVVGSQWSNVRFNSLTMKSDVENWPCVALGTPQGITFDGFTASGGSALVSQYDGMTSPARSITFRNGTYYGRTLPTSVRGIDGLVMENVKLASGSPSTTTTLSATTTTTTPAATTTTATSAPTTTTTGAPTTTTTRAPSTTTVTTYRWPWPMTFPTTTTTVTTTRATTTTLRLTTTTTQSGWWPWWWFI